MTQRFRKSDLPKQNISQKGNGCRHTRDGLELKNLGCIVLRHKEKCCSREPRIVNEMLLF